MYNKDLDKIHLIEKMSKLSNEEIHNIYYPKIEIGMEPQGSNLLIQLQYTPKSTASGIVLPEELRDTESYEATIGKVIAIGPLAYKERNFKENKLVDYPEGSWCVIGDIVYISRNGHRIKKMAAELNNEAIHFVLCRDEDILCIISSDLRNLARFSRFSFKAGQ
jgi:co-chaperonin GroES (HSP10)